jgi:hypothetical protein
MREKKYEYEHEHEHDARDWPFTGPMIGAS